MEPLLLVRWSTLLLSSLVNFANHHRARLRVSEPLSSVSAEEASVSERQVEASRKILEARLAKHATALASANWMFLVGAVAAKMPVRNTE